MISFDVSRDEVYLIAKIAQRAWSKQTVLDNRTLMDWEMDITSCHANGTKLRLADLLNANDFNFIHDVYGISNHLNRLTGKLEDCFVPRYAVKQ